MLLSTMLIDLFVKVVFVVSLCVLLLHPFLLAFNQEFFGLVLDQKLPHIELLSPAPLCLIQRICGSGIKDILAATGLKGGCKALGDG